MKLEISDRLAKAIILARGAEDGRDWLRLLPRRSANYAARWGLDLIEVADGGAMSCCIFSATATGEEVVLKIPFDARSGRMESRSLQRWAQVDASPRVLAVAPTSGVYLMTRVRPGLAAMPSGSATDSERFVELITRMTCPDLAPWPGLRSVAAIAAMRVEWARERVVTSGYDHEAKHLDRAERLMHDLIRTTRSPVVMHADLQAKNILVGPGGHWQAIDPFTCRGDLNAEAALWAVLQEDSSTIDSRIEQLSAATGLLDGARLRDWCSVFGIIEYRAHFPESARRIREFTAGLEW